MLNPQKTKWTLLKLIVLVLLLVAVPTTSLAQGSAKGKAGGAKGASSTSKAPGDTNDSNEGTAWDIRKNYFLRFPVAKEFGPSTDGGKDVIEKGESKGPGIIVHSKSGPVQVWPVIVPTAISKVPTKRDEAIMEDLFQTFGLPVSDTQFQVIQRYNDNRMLEQLFDPEKLMWLVNSIGNIQAISVANSSANLARNQATSAIDFAQSFLPGMAAAGKRGAGSSGGGGGGADFSQRYMTNFTAQAGNAWNRIRDQLFVPMAILLLLPGAVLSQVKAIVAQGTTVLGDVSPFDGILRAFVAIFLIPATYLVVNYGIDVSNSITYTISSEYNRIFHSNMYEDARCSQARAFPIRDKDSQDNALLRNSTNQTGKSRGDDDVAPFRALEIISFDIVEEDPCDAVARADAAGQAQGSKSGGQGLLSQLGQVSQQVTGGAVGGVAGLMSQGTKSGGYPGASSGKGSDEGDQTLKAIQRTALNGTNAALTASWNVLCAFQIAYLLYLFCIGPVVAALWVWPMANLRGALPSWVEGVVTLCFWSLFWNTTMASPQA
ncbi:MAG: hypothetical protein HY711_03890, partial [Candidatus Melainabacteria bacterium]|nr:hypothetical protein [Candidatus Melainabacteria bacterium]